MARAMKTAQIIASCLPGKPPVTSTGTLAPGLHAGSLLADLKGAVPVPGLLLVGHQPDMGELIAYLVADGSYAELAFPPGAAAKLTMEPGADPPDGRLHWLLSPDIVRRLSAKT
jgi:phosphohistidine phosphatase